jgi:predicted transcriptional regulator
VDANDKGHYGKRIENTAIRPVIMDLITEQDIQDTIEKLKTKRERQKAVAVRLHQQCYQQGGVLTYSDTAAIMRLSTSTVGKYIREYEKQTQEIVPRRGNIHDMGPTLTHKRIICIKHLQQGKDIQTTALETNHSPEAVTRYVRDFKRIHLCLKEGWTIEKISQATGLSKPLVDEYTQLIEENKTKDLSHFDDKELPF